MTTPQAITILQALADGRDPASGQPFPPDSPYQQADTVRALFLALSALSSAASAPLREKSPPNLRPSAQSADTLPATPAGSRWSAEEEQRLRDAFAAQTPIAAIAAAHGRTRGAITSRLIRLGLLAPDPAPPANRPLPTADSPLPTAPNPAPLPTANCSLPTDPAPALTPDDLKSLPF